MNDLSHNTEVEEALAGFLSPALPDVATTLQAWFVSEFNIASARAGYGRAHRLNLGFIVYGDYVDRFIEMCVPSLLWSGNLDALDRPLLTIHTDARGIEDIGKILRLLTAHAQVELRLIPQVVLDVVPQHESNKYWLLGCAQQLHMQMAKCAGYDYHMGVPDAVYASGFFKNLRRLANDGHHAILIGSLSTRLEEIAPEIKHRRRRSATGIAAAELTALGLDYLHAFQEQSIMNGRIGYNYPPVPQLFMIGRNALHFLCPHMSIAYLSHDLLMLAPLRLFNTIDADLPAFIPDKFTPYAPQAEDGISFIELSPADRVTPPWMVCKPGDFAVRFWIMCHCNPAFERFFALTHEMPLPDDYASHWRLMSDDEIEQLKERARRAVKDSESVANMILPLVASAFERGKTWHGNG